MMWKVSSNCSAKVEEGNLGKAFTIVVLISQHGEIQCNFGNWKGEVYMP